MIIPPLHAGAREAAAPVIHVLLGAFLATLAACGSEGPTGESTDPAEISVSPSSANLISIGETTDVQATVLSANGIVLSQSLQWSSSNTAVATVSASGDLNENAQITARSNGFALITATAAGIAGGVEVVVEQAVASLTFQRSPQDAVLGESSGEVWVAALDSGDSPVATAVGPVTLDVMAGSPGSLVGGSRTGTMQSGIATFADVRMDQLGAGYRLLANWDAHSVTSIPFDVVPALDAVRVTNALGGEAGFLVDGFRGGVALNDFAVVSDQTIVEVGVVNPAASGPNEVVTFAPGRRPAITPATWSTGVDTVSITLDVPIEIDLTVWIVQGPFATQRSRVLAAMVTTGNIWTAENAGLALDSIAVYDATGDPDAAGLVQVNLCNSQSALETQIGKVEGTINLYYVETVDGGTDRGRACPIGGDHAVMAENSGDELLSHEIGHLLSLTHTDAITQNFDRTNVMHSASSSRQYLTEGQTFRQQFDPVSAINNIFGFRVSEARRCSLDTANGLCPAIEGRIWSDGSFPATLSREQGGLTGVGEAHPPRDNSDAATTVHRWIEVSCEMEGNEGLSDRLRAIGPAAVDALADILVNDSDPLYRRVALDGLAVVGGREAETLLRFSTSDPALEAPARAALQRLLANRRQPFPR